MVTYRIRVIPGDLAAVDREVDPPQVVFRWGLARVERMEGEQIFTGRTRGGQPLMLVWGLKAAIALGDKVFAALGKVHDVSVGGRSSHPDRLRREFFPRIVARSQPAGGSTKDDSAAGRTGGGGVPQEIEYLTAETERGRLAIKEVMGRSYTADAAEVPAQWARARVVDGVPVSFVLVDPDRCMQFPEGDVRYAFVCDVATRRERRWEGHFRAIMEHTFSALRATGVSLVLTHGRYPLYRRFGFEVFTHHCGVLVTPNQIERRLGTQVSVEARQLLVVEESEYLHDDLLMITGVKASTVPECAVALRAAAGIARERGKARILLEHPAAPSYGSRYPIHPSPETLLTAVARACGAEVRIQGADPESGSVPDADWIKVLDAAMLLGAVLDCVKESRLSLPKGAVCFDTDAGAVTIDSLGDTVTASGEPVPGTAVVRWPSSALAQLVTGYQPVEVLCTIHKTSLPAEAMSLLQALFPRRWRFSRNESWTFRS